MKKGAADKEYIAYSHCEICPRRCGVDRNKGQTGVCGMDHTIYVARAALHFWEEPCISGKKGSGAVFFSGCNVGCVFCQNRVIAKERYGKPVTVEQLCEIFLKLEKQGANNINLVTPTHYILQIRDALLLAKEKGLSIPIVYNTSAYELVDSLKLLDGLVDIYLPDCKYLSTELSFQYSKARDYYQHAQKAIEEMVRQVPEALFDERGMMKKGVIIRHLLLPGHVKEAKKVVETLYDAYGDKVYFSLMNQYTPFSYVKEQYPELDRQVTKREYDRLIQYVLDLGIENAFIQEGNTAKESFVPQFDGEGVSESFQ